MADVFRTGRGWAGLPSRYPAAARWPLREVEAAMSAKRDDGPAASEGEIARARRTAGSGATSPGRLPFKGWVAVWQRVKLQSKERHLPLLAAGVAFRLLLAVAPALIAAISIWGLVADPDALADQITQLAEQLPEEGGALAETMLTNLTDNAGGQLGWALLVTVVVMLWSTGSGVLGLIDGCSAAYGEADTRGFLRRRGVGLVGGLAGILVLFVIVVVATALPQLVAALGGDDALVQLATWLRWPVLLVLLVGLLLLLYLVGPDRTRARWRWALPGAVLGALTWTVASIGFGIYVSQFADLDDTYGPLAGVIIVMLWTFLSAFAVLLGAVVNAELERQTAVDTTAGPERPAGERGAVVADELPSTYRPQQFDGR
jgi:membrane protein